MKIFRPINEPARENLSWEERWKGADQGLITCWEAGRNKRREAPELASQACAGQLIILPWKGGVEKAIKKKQKYGTLFYLAMWQGLRGEDLNIDLDTEPVLTCSATGMTVIFTGEYKKYAEA